MFSPLHFVWLGICAVIIAASTAFLLRRRPPLRSVLTVLCCLCVASELVKVFTSVEMVPSADGSEVYPYLPLRHVPLHLCSLQIILIFYARFARDGGTRTAVLAFMYPTCLAGAALALIMPSIYSGPLSFADAFLWPMSWQFFLYHAGLVVLGLYIILSKQVDLRPKHFLSTCLMLGGAAFVSIYLNSIFASPTYENGELLSVDYVTNFFFTFEPPFDLGITEKWQWMLYVAAICAIGLAVISALYIPVFRRAKREKPKTER